MCFFFYFISYFIFFPIQVRAHTSPSIYSFVSHLLICKFKISLILGWFWPTVFWISAFSLLPETPTLLTARAIWCFLSFRPEEELNNSFWGWFWYHFLHWHLQTCLSDREHFRFVLLWRLQGNWNKCLKLLCMKASIFIVIFQYLLSWGGVPQCNSFPSADILTASPLICSRFRNCVYTYRILPDKENKLIVQVSHAVNHSVPQRCT